MSLARILCWFGHHSWWTYSAPVEWLGCRAFKSACDRCGATEYGLSWSGIGGR